MTTSGQVKLKAVHGSVAVTVTPGTFYTDVAGTTPAVFPVTVAAGSTVQLFSAQSGAYSLSALADGSVEVATPGGVPLTFELRDGMVESVEIDLLPFGMRDRSGTYAALAEHTKNILRYGVTTGTTSSQTVAIKAALDASPGEAFYFPPGDYRLDTGLVITNNNTLILAPGARIYAGAAMTTLIDYDNGLSASSYAEDKGIIGGGLIDGALLASKTLAIGSVTRFSLGGGLTIKDPINRGIWLKPAGAEVIGNDIRLYNSGTTNAADNWAIEADMGDSQFTNVIARDFTNGVWDKGNNVWNDIHPWIGSTAQLTVRYPGSIAFLADSDCIFTRAFSDTYQTAFKTQAASGYRKVRITDPKIFANTGNLTSALASANPGVCFNLSDGAQVFVRGGSYTGAQTAHTFVTGTTTRFNHGDWLDRVPGSVTGLATYKRGVQLGSIDFSPTFYSHVTGLGSVVYTTRAGRLEVRDGQLTYTGRIVGTQGSDATGNYRIGNLPFPVGPTAVALGVGGVTRRAGVASAVGVYGANGASGNLVATVYDGAGAEIAVTPSVAFDIHFSITCPFTYPS